jgi:glycosyltransferase involved in cell wall biosynthesis
MKINELPLVSIVTPVYNGELYLRECIKSVLAQTYDYWGYTIVNNCSTDGTLSIAREYAAKDPRIQIHNNESFVQAIENYNVAFRQISPKSKYCKVVAADDWIFPECIEKMVHVAEEHPSVAIVGAYGYGFHKAGLVWDGLPYPSTIVSGHELGRASLLGGPYVFGTPTSLLFRSDIVRSRHAFYNESNLHADNEACLEFLEHNDFGFVHQVLTFSRVREDSQTSYSKRLNTYLPDHLHMLIKYGPKYLSHEEMEQRIRNHLVSYYRYLGKQLYKRRGPLFWNFHKEQLAAIGYSLSIGRLAASVTSCALDFLLNPKRTVEELVHRLRGA